MPKLAIAPVVRGFCYFRRLKNSEVGKKDEDELLPWLVTAEEAIQNSKDSSIQKRMGSELFLDLAFLTYNIAQRNNLELLKILEKRIQETQQKDTNRKKPK